MNRTFKITILLSLLVHLALFGPALFYAPPEKPIPEKDQNIEISLVQPQPEQPPEPKQEPPKPKEQPKKEEVAQQEDKPPPSKHLEDDINKANNSDGTSETAGGKPSKARQKSQAKQEAGHIAEQKRPTSNQVDPKQLKALQDIFGKELEVQESQEQSEQTLLGALDEGALDDSVVENPLNEQEEEKARWFNEVLKRISEQVEYIWIKPEGVSKHHWGKIKMDIDPQGYLLSAWVHLPSGSQELDNSALLAIRGVIRYKIPQSPKLSRYYRHLIFEYSGEG